MALLPDVFTVCQSEEVELAVCEEEASWREEDAAAVETGLVGAAWDVELWGAAPGGTHLHIIQH